MHEEGRAKKIDQFALAIAVYCKADVIQENLNEKDFEKILSQINRYSANKHSILIHTRNKV